MCIIKHIHRFITHGISVFRAASAGRYHEESESIKTLKEELMEPSSAHQDAKKLREDRRRVGLDMRRSFNKLVLENG